MRLYYRAIVCLANSRKHRGKCIAGKDISNYVWVRPVANTETGELVIDQIRFDDGSIPKVLDIVRVPLKKRHPKFFQPENMLIRSGEWEKIGTFRENKLDDLCDNPPTLWVNDKPSKDRISFEYLEENRIESSLLLIKPTDIVLKREDRYNDYGQQKKILRAQFTYNKIRYDLRVTDPYIEKKYLKLEPGTYSLSGDKIYLSISLSEPYKGNCYKLIASVIQVMEKSSENIILKLEESYILFDKLIHWRLEQAKKDDVLPFIVASNRSLKEIIDLNVRSKDELKQVHGFGEKRIDKYGDEIITIIEKFHKTQKAQTKIHEYKEEKNKNQEGYSKDDLIRFISETLDSLDYNVGRSYIKDILKGSKSARMNKLDKNKVKYYGVLKDYTGDEVLQIIDELIAEGHFEIKKSIHSGFARPFLHKTEKNDD